MKTFCYVIILYLSEVTFTLASEDRIFFIQNAIIKSFLLKEQLAKKIEPNEQRSAIYKSMTKDIFFYWYQGRYLKGIKSEKIDKVVIDLYARVKGKSIDNNTIENIITTDPVDLKKISRCTLNNGSVRVYFYSEEKDHRYLLSKKEYLVLLAEFKKFLTDKTKAKRNEKPKGSALEFSG